LAETERSTNVTDRNCLLVNNNKRRLVQNIFEQNNHIIFIRMILASQEYEYFVGCKCQDTSLSFDEDDGYAL
jgi:mRNA-degrading endonuclease HigB of HigAB toxin-antitoxin module